MKKKRLLTRAATMIAMIALSIATISCNFKGIDKHKPTGRILEFNYSYGSFHGGYWEYNITRTDDDTAYFRASGYNGVEKDISTDIDGQVFIDLISLMDEQDIYSWNGFDKSDDDILDGYGFSLHVIFENGEISAGGYHRLPDNYGKAHGALSSFLDDLK